MIIMTTFGKSGLKADLTRSKQGAEIFMILLNTRNTVPLPSMTCIKNIDWLKKVKNF